MGASTHDLPQPPVYSSMQIQVDTIPGQTNTDDQSVLYGTVL